MRSKAETVLNHLRQALVACDQQQQLEPVKMILHKAIAQCQQVMKKAVRKQTALEHYQEKAVQARRKWEEMLAAGRSDIALNMLEEKINADNEDTNSRKTEP